MGNGSRLGDIRETSSNAVEILRELRNPEIQQSLNKAKEMTDTVKEIVETMKTPEWTQNLENIRKMIEETNSTSARMENTIKGMQQNGGFDDAKGLIRSTRNLIEALSKEEGGIKGRDLRELTVSLKELMQSLKVLMDELALTAAESNRSGTLRDMKEAVRHTSKTYDAVKRAQQEE